MAGKRKISAWCKSCRMRHRASASGRVICPKSPAVYRETSCPTNISVAGNEAFLLAYPEVFENPAGRTSIQRLVSIVQTFQGHNEGEKTEFRRHAQALLRDVKGRLDTNADLRWNPGGSAVLGDVTLHGDWFYVQISQIELGILYRAVTGREDYAGGVNRWFPWMKLLAEGAQGLARAVEDLRPAAARNPSGRWYYGFARRAGVPYPSLVEVFSSKKKPTRSSHGSRYSSVTGPYHTKEETVRSAEGTGLRVTENPLTVPERMELYGSARSDEGWARVHRSDAPLAAAHAAGEATGKRWAAIRYNPPEGARWAAFNRFELWMTLEQARDAGGPGPRDVFVKELAKDLAAQRARIDPEKIREELWEYGAWDDQALADDDANWERIVWIAAGNILNNGPGTSENPCGAAGEEACPFCGAPDPVYVPGQDTGTGWERYECRNEACDRAYMVKPGESPRQVYSPPISPMENSPRKFDRFGRGGAYRCGSCRKLTRDTGRDEQGVGLCFACYEEAGWENCHSDEGHTRKPRADCPICQNLGLVPGANPRHPYNTSSRDILAELVEWAARMGEFEAPAWVEAREALASNDLPRQRQAVMDLLDWAGQMGGWEAQVWRRAERHIRTRRNPEEEVGGVFSFNVPIETEELRACIECGARIDPYTPGGICESRACQMAASHRREAARQASLEASAAREARKRGYDYNPGACGVCLQNPCEC